VLFFIFGVVIPGYVADGVFEEPGVCSDASDPAETAEGDVGAGAGVGVIWGAAGVVAVVSAGAGVAAATVEVGVVGVGDKVDGGDVDLAPVERLGSLILINRLIFARVRSKILSLF
jgi:hypothetical protein